MSCPNGRASNSMFDAMRVQIASTPMEPTRRLGVAFLSGRRRVATSLALGLGLAVFVVAIVLVFATSSAPPAFAVTSNGNGTVTITLSDLADINGLNAELQQMGYSVRAVPVVAGCNAPVQIVGSNGPPRTLEAAPLSGPTGVSGPSGSGSGGNPSETGPVVSWTISTDVPAGDTVVLASTGDGQASAAQLVVGQAPSCAGLSQG